MKRISWTVVTLICLLLIIMGLLTMLSTRFPLPWQCSKLYWQYRGQEGIEATYVKQYPVDDTTLVDVTLLHATTDSAWESLCHGFITPEIPDNIKENIINGNSVTVRIVSKDDPRIVVTPDSVDRYDYLLFSPTKTTIGLFHVENVEQIFTILSKEVHELSHPIK